MGNYSRHPRNSPTLQDIQDSRKTRVVCGLELLDDIERAQERWVYLIKQCEKVSVENPETFSDTCLLMADWKIFRLHEKAMQDYKKCVVSGVARGSIDIFSQT